MAPKTDTLFLVWNETLEAIEEVFFKQEDAEEYIKNNEFPTNFILLKTNIILRTMLVTEFAEVT